MWWSLQKSKETVFILWGCLRVFFIRKPDLTYPRSIMRSLIVPSPLLRYLSAYSDKRGSPELRILLLYLQPRFPICSCTIKDKWLKWCSLSLCQKPWRNAIAYTSCSVLSLLVGSMCSYCRGTLWSLNRTLEVWMYLWQKAGFSWCLKFPCHITCNISCPTERFSATNFGV